MKEDESKRKRGQYPNVVRIVELREQQGWSRKDLAKNTKLDERTINALERGEPKDWSTFRALADRFKVDVKELVLSSKVEAKASDQECIPGSNTNKIAFVSHSTPDDFFVGELQSLLRSMFFDEVFIDSQSIKPDEEFWPVIEAGIRTCDAFVFVISMASIQSPWVKKEVEFARSLHKRIIPLWIEDCKIPSIFETRDVVDFRPRNRITDRKLSPSRILRHSPEILFGRESWLDALDAAWAKPHLNVYTLVAWGGVGKTSLVAHWVSKRLAAKGWPGVERYFDWSFYSQGTGESRQTSSDLFMQDALTFFGDPDPIKGSAWERGERLARLIRQHRTLLILDGIEPLQYPFNDPQAGRLKDQGLEALLQGLAQDNKGLCVVTTREHLKNIENQTTTEEQKLDKLVKEAAVALLQHLQIVGTEEEMHAAWRDAGGHALTLQLLGRFLADAHGGDIRHYKEVKFEEADLERQGRSAFKVMIAYERWLQSAGPERQRELAVLRLTGLFDRPMSRECLDALRAEPAIAGLTDELVKLKEPQWNIALKRLADIDLLTVTPEAIDAHPLIREYFAKQLRDKQPEAFRAAHSRLFDYLCKNTPHRPDGLDGLAPLYQAVVHGCLADRQPEACEKVYVDRINRGTGDDGFYSTKKLGAVGADLAAVAAFFEEPWSKVSHKLAEAAQAWLLNEAAYRLHALGRLPEALQPMRAGLEMRVHQEKWLNAARVSSNLSELEVTLGRLPEAVKDARLSIRYADQSQDALWQMGSRTTAADALHQVGERAEAGDLFAEAEEMQKKMQAEFDLLYSLAGFRYCDWLLAPAEQAAWRVVLRGTETDADRITIDREALAKTVTEVERRATITLNWMNNQQWLLDIALDHLTLTRTGLFQAILAHPLPQPQLDLPHVTEAVNGLRHAGAIHHIPKGLLTAALYHFVRGDRDEAERKLQEAQQIAERGPMPLYLADVHLHRARLFRDKAELAQAAKLIRQLGYGCRYEELADAEQAAQGSWFRHS